MAKIYIIHENSEWTAPLIKNLEALGLPYEDWFIDQGTLDLAEAPPEGIFYNRMSASSHTRDHRFSAEYTAAILSWLEAHGRTVINTSRALQLEVSKVAQYTSLEAHGVRTPRTIAAVGKDEILKASQKFSGPFITKHNRGGKGLGVQLFQSQQALAAYVHGSDFEIPVDGITLIQEYIQASQPFITRCEFIGGKFVYAVQVDTSKGFQLCPADACQIGDTFCPVGESEQRPKFRIIESFSNPVLDKYAKFLETNRIHIAGIEFITDEKGEIYTYDVNTNTNYNSDAEAIAGISGMAEIAKYLGSILKEKYNL